ncbi:MAG: prepilin-type N-terminal cleavage/methylation domain-containing protein [Candidatus Gygaella obscura]|nr:prepilin-type N-terminal cleavage/methylation domain-containing protein [Candidatus Gygaella obscura]
MYREKKAFTFVELVISLTIFMLLFGVLVTIFLSINKTYSIESVKLEQQQQARIAMDNIISSLRKSSANWDIEGVEYPALINGDGSQIDYYLPVFDANNEITQLRGARIYLSTTNPGQLLLKVGSDPSEVIGSFIDTASSSRPYFEFSVDSNNLVEITIPVKKDNEKKLVFKAKVLMRNSDRTLSSVVIEELLEEEDET